MEVAESYSHRRHYLNWIHYPCTSPKDVSPELSLIMKYEALHKFLNQYFTLPKKGVDLAYALVMVLLVKSSL